MTRPIRPDEIVTQKLVPDEIYEVFNQFIIENYSDGTAQVFQKDVVKRLVAKGLVKAEIFERGWLNIEGAYEEAGWSVGYDRPAYNETYDAVFIFEKKT